MLLTEKKRLQNQTIFACQYIKKKEIHSVISDIV